VSPFSNQYVLLLVFYGFEIIRQRTDLSLYRGNNVYNDLLDRGEAVQQEEQLAILANEYYTMNVEAT
jgi:hypothetical protein